MKIALDWTPNVLHTGFYVAAAQQQLALEFISPELDDYDQMPAEKLLRGEVDLAIGPPEAVVDHYLKNEEPELVILAALLPQNATAFVTLEPKAADPTAWKDYRYAALELPFEKALIRELVQAAGGDSAPQLLTIGKLETWEALKIGAADLAWAFLPVEGAEAQYQGLELAVTTLESYGIPYPPCPLLLTTRRQLATNSLLLANVLEQLQQGYSFAWQEPLAAVKWLHELGNHGTLADLNLLHFSQLRVNAFYQKQQPWGVVDVLALQSYADWLYEKKIIDRPLQAAAMLATALCRTTATELLAQ